MRRIVHDYITAAVDRAKPDLERFLAGHLERPESVPLIFAERLASIGEIRGVRITPRFRADYPLTDVIVTMRVAITARTVVAM